MGNYKSLEHHTHVHAYPHTRTCVPTYATVLRLQKSHFCAMCFSLPGAPHASVHTCKTRTTPPSSFPHPLPFSSSMLSPSPHFSASLSLYVFQKDFFSPSPHYTLLITKLQPPYRHHPRPTSPNRHQSHRSADSHRITITHDQPSVITGYELIIFQNFPSFSSNRTRATNPK